MGCDDDGAQSTTTTTSQVARICFKAHALQTLGGERLAAIDTYEEDPAAPVVATTQLDGIVKGAFAPSIRGDIRRVERSDTEEAQAIVDAATKAVAAVEAEPKLLLDEAALTRTFAQAQERAEQADAVSSNCT
jgi:hypothetical protein